MVGNFLKEMLSLNGELEKNDPEIFLGLSIFFLCVWDPVQNKNLNTVVQKLRISKWWHENIKPKLL